MLRLSARVKDLSTGKVNARRLRARGPEDPMRIASALRQALAMFYGPLVRLVNVLGRIGLGLPRGRVDIRGEFGFVDIPGEFGFFGMNRFLCDPPRAHFTFQ